MREIVESAPAEQFFAHPSHPYARALLKALPDAARRGEPLAAIAGTGLKLALRGAPSPYQRNSSSGSQTITWIRGSSSKRSRSSRPLSCTPPC